MVFLEKFRFPTYDDEFNLLTDTEYDSPSVYPFGVLCEMSKRKSFEIEAYAVLSVLQINYFSLFGTA